ncbi:MAG: replication initiation factor domain-containing protein [Oscillospiraceae bacterium]|nr:replication initiation factor domain-containing protein [Oscillospiraceae bacterium]
MKKAIKSIFKKPDALIDATTLVYHDISTDDFINSVLNLGGLKWLVEDHGRYGYSKTTSFGAVKILSEGRPDMGICLEMQGQGCRELEQLCGRDIFYSLLTTKLAGRINATRIDFAVDDFQNKLKLSKIEKKVANGGLVSPLENKLVQKGLANTNGHTVYIGSRSSCLVRIYDKAAEQNTSFPWTRVEIEIRHAAAEQLRKLVVDQISNNCPDKYTEIVKMGIGVIADKIRFIDRKDKNVSRCPTCKWWSEFLDGAKPLHLTGKAKMPTDIGQALDWLKKQVAPTLTLLVAYLGPSVIDTIIKNGIPKIEYQRAITWAQQLKAVGMPIDPKNAFDANTPDDIERNICQQIAEHFTQLINKSN